MQYLLLQKVEPQLDQIIQNRDGDVEVSFVLGQTSRLALTRSVSSRDYGRPYNVSYPSSSRHSVSSTIDLEQMHTLNRERSNPLEGFRLSDHQIPHGIYRPSSQPPPVIINNDPYKTHQGPDPDDDHHHQEPFLNQGFPPKKADSFYA